jgi:hypothetical protein
MITLVLIVILLMKMMAEARPWKRVEMPGKTLQVISLSFWSKILTHRSSLMALVSGCSLCALAGWLPFNMAVMMVAFAFVILLVPMRYTLTTKGVAVGPGVFRLWNEFSGFKTGRLGLELAHPSNFGRLTLFIRPAEMASVLKYVEQHVKVQSSNS